MHTFLLNLVTTLGLFRSSYARSSGTKRLKLVTVTKYPKMRSRGVVKKREKKREKKKTKLLSVHDYSHPLTSTESEGCRWLTARLTTTDYYEVLLRTAAASCSCMSAAPFGSHSGKSGCHMVNQHSIFRRLFQPQTIIMNAQQKKKRD